MTAAVGQSAVALGSGSAAATPAITTNALASSFLIGISQGTGSTPTPTDNYGNVYTQVSGSPIVDTSNSEQWNVFLATNGRGGPSHSAKVSGALSSNPVIFLVEITGAASSSILDGTPGTQFVNGGGFTNQVTTTVANDLVISFVSNGSNASATMTPSSGLTKFISNTVGGIASTAIGYVLQVATGSSPPNTPTWTASGGTQGAIITVPILSAVLPVITAQPQNVCVTQDNGVLLTVAGIASSGALTYQWQDNRTGSFANCVDGSDATTASYTTGPMPSNASGRQYNCILTDSNGNTTSNTVSVTVLPFPWQEFGLTRPPRTGGLPFGLDTREWW
ncbi:MAG TPA: hypothetical protein VMU14_20210 [Acidimicrobiales bacterium]|nr:hypothetical protein [Acidimicrobiales bacterium]